jgi:hypothetical protein
LPPVMTATFPSSLLMSFLLSDFLFSRHISVLPGTDVHGD